MLNALEGEELVSKREAMKLASISETHITRYLSTGVITAWKLPDLTPEPGRGEWLVDRDSVEVYTRARREGWLQELLDGNPDYVTLRRQVTAEIRELRRAGRVDQRDPLTEGKSAYHPGCFTVPQVASHVGLSTTSVYAAIKAGQLTARVARIKSKPRYAIEPAEARRYAAWVRERPQAARRWHSRRRQAIAEAGLLAVRDLAERWGVTEEAVYRYRQDGLVSRRWGRYLVFEPADVERFEREVGIGG
jgi:predicted DNA-binding transcriptional regulator AlpA